MNLQPHIKRTILQALLITAGLFLSVMANAQHHATFKGRLIMPGGGRSQVIMTLTNGVDTMQVDIARNGRFEFHVPMNDSLSLTVSSEEHVTKQIIVDTTRPKGRGASITRNEQLEFDILLERNSANGTTCYAGPSGYIYHNGVRTVLAPRPQARVTTYDLAAVN